MWTESLIRTMKTQQTLNLLKPELVMFGQS